MTIWPITFEDDLRRRLLDVVYGQWHDLGVPFSDAQSSAEVIDPEALLWCSLEFLPTEPRLCESVVAWLHRHEGYVIRQRLRSWARGNDFRGRIWRILDKTSPSVADHDLEFSAELGKFCERLARIVSRQVSPDSRVGNPLPGPSTLLFQARDLLGADSRHFLLLYLLANPAGGRLRDIQRWTGYSYRTTSEIATRWETAGIAAIDHGYCRLTNLQPWEALLRQGTDQIVLVNFFQLFEACVELLRGLARARRKNLGWNSSVVSVLRGDAYERLSASRLGDTRTVSASVTYLGELFPKRS